MDSNLHKDLVVLGLDHIELEMSFPDGYPFEPPFARVVKPRFRKQTGFVMNGALCMELLTRQGWNPVNDIESVIVSIRSLIVVGDGRLAAAYDLPERKKMDTIIPNVPSNAQLQQPEQHVPEQVVLRRISKKNNNIQNNNANASNNNNKKISVGQYTAAEARAAYTHLSDYHAKKGWDTNGWWARKG